MIYTKTIHREERIFLWKVIGPLLKGENRVMDVEIKILEEVTNTYAVIYTNQISEEVLQVVEMIGNIPGIITAIEEEKTIVLRPNDIYIVRVESNKAIIYCKEKKYTSKKRLIELEKILKGSFMKISKTTIVNLNYITSAEASFGGMMCLVMKNGCKDYVSRKYLPDLKRYLGI
jgi:two-component system response regulator LytT